jgi:hypothetical protein
MMLNMQHKKLKLDEEKSKYVILVQQNGFCLTFFHTMLSLVKGTTFCHMQPSYSW